jgi:hypothetical protein
MSDPNRAGLLEAEHDALRAENAALVGEVECLTRRVDERSRRLDKGSKHSSMPSSSDSPKHRAEATRARAERRAAHAGMRKVVFVGMAGKLAKLAAGVMMTHFHRSEVDTGLLGALAVEAGAPWAVVEAATETTTARHFFDACMAHGCLAPLALLCERARSACLAHAGSSFEVEVVLVDSEGSAVLWHAGPEGSASGSA